MFLRHLLPDLAAVSRRSQRAVTAATVLMFALLAVNIAHTQFGLGGSGLDTLLNAWGQNLVLACACAVVAVILVVGLTIPLDTQAQQGSLEVGAVQGNVPGTGLDAFGQRKAVLNNHVQGTYALLDQVDPGELDLVL